MRRATTLVLFVCGTALLPAPSRAAKPTAAQALRLTPIQRDVDFDVPEGEAAEKATIKAEKADGHSAWVVRDEGGQILRRFADTNDDNIVDRWSYYKDGLEVYRDIDADYNGKADQYRWFHYGGIRWGLDEDEDGRVDSWKMISAEEVAAEVVAALKQHSTSRFARLLLSEEELASLGLGSAGKSKLASKIEEAEEKFTSLARRQKVIGPATEFVSFGATRPGIVPAGTQGAEQDLMVYENAAALVENDSKHEQIVVGTLVRVGDCWRLIDLPQVEGAEEVADSGYFFRASLTSTRPETPAAQTPEGPSEAVQQAMADLEKLDAAIAGASSSEQARLNAKRADLLERLAQQSDDQQMQTQWLRQLADTVSAAVQTGTYPDGVERLQAVEKKIARRGDADNLLAYVKFRRLTAAYSQALRDPKADFAKVQEQWLESLEEFVKEHPDSRDSAEAMLQLAIAQEFSGDEERAQAWYSRILEEYPDSPPAKKAAGAKQRLQCEGQVIRVQGQSVAGESASLADLRGNLVLLHYWATWCGPCKNDMESIKELYSKYGSRGFRVLGVNLDHDSNEVAQFLRSHRFPWTHLQEPGGLEGRLANEMGILTLPTMLLIGEDGRVISRSIHVSEVEPELKKRLK